MAAMRKTVSLTANTATPVTLTEETHRWAITVLSTATTVVLYFRTDGVTAVVDADECDVIAGGVGAFDDNITAGLGCKTISIIATADAKINVEKVA